MKNVLIIGSTGMIGGLILEQCINSNDIKQITIINRRSICISHPKVKEVIHSDFMNLEAIKDSFSNQDIAFYCLGVYTGQVATDEFNKITIDYTKAFGTLLKAQSPRATVCFLSGTGADSSEKSSVLFAKAKGIAENFLLSLNFPKTYIFRPGYIYPITPRKEPNFGYRLFRVLYRPVSLIYPNIGLTSVQLANKMFAVGLNGNSKIVFENKEIRS
jgi:nucleoside-diphosphate-sugar epimerase